MRPRPRLEEAGNEPVRAAGDGPAEHRNHQREKRRQVPRHEHRRDEGPQAADEELPVHSEVDQAGTERHHEAQAGEDERRGADQGFGHGSECCRDVVGVTALDRGNDATRVADRPGEHHWVALEHASERAADRGERIGADVSQVLEVGQHDEDRTQEESREQGEGRADVRDGAHRGFAACRSVSPPRILRVRLLATRPVGFVDWSCR